MDTVTEEIATLNQPETPKSKTTVVKSTGIHGPTVFGTDKDGLPTLVAAPVGWGQQDF